MWALVNQGASNTVPVIDLNFLLRVVVEQR
jgi:hypothetical protein